MANMSYCRFENTYGDLLDCYHRLDEIDGLSEEEARARRKIIKLCAKIQREYGDEDA